MNINRLLQDWESHYRSDVATAPLHINLPIAQVARIKALAEIYDGRSEQQIIADLLGVALDQLEAALPYVQSKRVIAEDEFGDPLFADEGPTPRLLELTRKYYQQLEAEYSTDKGVVTV